MAPIALSTLAGIAIILATLAVLVLCGVMVFGWFASSTRRTRRGVEHPREQAHRGPPPFESIERHSHADRP